MRAVYSLILVFTIQVVISTCEVTVKRYCSFYYYFSKAKRTCTLCTDFCRSGTGLNQNCGYDEYGKKIKPSCSRCKDGYFSKSNPSPYLNSPSPTCQPCRQCIPHSRTKRHCTPTRNTKCKRCPRGMYKDKNGGCLKCSYCCKGMLEARINVVKACKPKRMGRCSCNIYTRCYGKDNNGQCDAKRQFLQARKRNRY